MPNIQNAYQLCEEVCQAIEASPGNYCQSIFTGDPKDPDTGYMLSHRAPEGQYQEPCGTVFCRAGHMISALDHDRGIIRTPREWALSHHYSMVQVRAERILFQAGIGENAIESLFRGNALHCETGVPSLRYGTKEYADAGVAGMRQFMARYESKLKAYILKEDD